MYQETLESRLERMEPRELFYILLGRAEDYNEEALGLVSKELERRGLTRESVADQFSVRFNNEPVEVENRAEAGQLLDREMSIWDTLAFGNYLQEYLFVQKGSAFWIIQHLSAVDGVWSFGMNDEASVKTMVQNFLSLEEWEPAEEDLFVFEDWETMLTTSSLFYIEGLTAQLEEADIPFLLKRARGGGGDPFFGASSTQQRLALLIPGDAMDDYQSLMASLGEKKAALLAQLEQKEAADDMEGQLEVYSQLDELALVDSYIYYNKGCVLFDMDRVDEAAEAVMLSRVEWKRDS